MVKAREWLKMDKLDFQLRVLLDLPYTEEDLEKEIPNYVLAYLYIKSQRKRFADYMDKIIKKPNLK